MEFPSNPLICPPRGRFGCAKAALLGLLCLGLLPTHRALAAEEGAARQTKLKPAQIAWCARVIDAKQKRQKNASTSAKKKTQKPTKTPKPLMVSAQKHKRSGSQKNPACCASTPEQNAQGFDAYVYCPSALTAADTSTADKSRDASPPPVPPTLAPLAPSPVTAPASVPARAPAVAGDSRKNVRISLGPLPAQTQEPDAEPATSATPELPAQTAENAPPARSAARSPAPEPAPEQAPAQDHPGLRAGQSRLLLYSAWTYNRGRSVPNAATNRGGDDLDAAGFDASLGDAPALPIQTAPSDSTRPSASIPLPIYDAVAARQEWQQERDSRFYGQRGYGARDIDIHNALPERAGW